MDHLVQLANPRKCNLNQALFSTGKKVGGTARPISANHVKKRKEKLDFDEKLPNIE